MPAEPFASFWRDTAPDFASRRYRPGRIALDLSAAARVYAECSGPWLGITGRVSVFKVVRMVAWLG